MCVLACRCEWECCKLYAEVLQEQCPGFDDQRMRASPEDKDLEPPVVTPYLIRDNKNAEMAAEGSLDRAMVEKVMDFVASWLQPEEMKRAGCYPRADSAGSVLCSVPSAVRELFQRFQGRGATRQAADEG